MQPIKTLSLGASALCLGLCTLASSALADDSQLYGVANIDILLSAVPVITVRNVANNHYLDNLQLAVQGNTFQVRVGGYVDCTGVQIENWTYREGHFLSGGAFGIGRTSLLMSETLPNSTDINHVSDIDANQFQVPVALLANPQINIDPVAIVMAAAEQAPNKVEYLRQDHSFMVKIPLRWEADCAYYIRNKIKKNTIVEAAETSYLTKDVSLNIKYKGDPQLFKATISPQLSQGGGLPNQVQVGDQPFKITDMSFQPNMPHHVGACPAETTIRVNYMGQGKGEIRIRVNDGGQTIHTSQKIAFDAKNGKQHHDFEIAVPKPPQHQLNQTKNHNLKVYVRGKGEEEQVWPSHYQQMDTALWKHRCTPVLNPVLGGNVGGKAGGYQQGGQQAKPAVVAPKLRLKTAPVEPRPARRAPN